MLPDSTSDWIYLRKWGGPLSQGSFLGGNLGQSKIRLLLSRVWWQKWLFWLFFESFRGLLHWVVLSKIEIFIPYWVSALFDAWQSRYLCCLEHPNTPRIIVPPKTQVLQARGIGFGLGYDHRVLSCHIEREDVIILNIIEWMIKSLPACSDTKWIQP